MIRSARQRALEGDLRKTVGGGVLCVVSVLAVIMSACDQGLTPLDAAGDPGFSGTISVQSAWPTADSLKDLRVVAFRNYPPQNILLEVASGNAVYTDTTLALYGTEIEYAIRHSSAVGQFRYIVVAQQYGENVFSDWRIVGLYAPTGDWNVPGEIEIPQGTYLAGIDMNIDFYNPPPQPF